MLRYTNDKRFEKFDDVVMVGALADVPTNIQISKIVITPKRRLEEPHCSVRSTNKLLKTLGLGALWNLSCSPVTVDSITVNTHLHDGRSVDEVWFEVETMQWATRVLDLLGLTDQQVDFIVIGQI